MNPKILIIEDQIEIAELIQLNLKLLNYDVTALHDGLEGFQQAQSNGFHLIILDIMLPNMDGLSICQALRSKSIQTPILMLTARQSESDRVIGLEIGADDYLTKPFSLLELKARVKALLRRSALQMETPNQNQLITSQSMRIDPLKRSVEILNTPVNLTAKEFDLLHYLAQSPGQVFSREQLLSQVWGYHHTGYEHTVNSHINRLRAKLEAVSGAPQFIQTVWGVGYKLND